MKLSRKRIIIGIALLLVLAISLVLYAATTKLDATTDGTENYTGVKLEAARHALDFDQSVYSPDVFMPFTKAHVDKVEPTKNEDRKGSDLQCNAGPDDTEYYSVTVRRIWLFGTTIDQRTYKMCNIAG